jgi:hypothetical protein
MESARDRRLRRYREDPEYRREVLERNRAHNATHGVEINERRRKRYAEDPEFRQRTLESKRARNAANKEEINARRATDPEYREIERAGALCRRRNRLKRLYGMSLEDYDALLAYQNGACALCERTDRKLCVDHDHATKEVRGLLCHGCNIGLGNCKDNPRIMRKGAAYLEAPPWRELTKARGR